MKILLFFIWMIQGYAAFNLTWGAPAVNLDEDFLLGKTDSNATIAIDPNGNAVATWSRTSDSGAIEDVWAAAYDHSLRVWTGSVKISGRGSAAHPRVAIDDNGNAIFIWDEGFPTQIMARTLSNEGIWTPPLEKAPEKINSSKNPQTVPYVVVDEIGNALAIWVESYQGSDHIYSAKKLKGTNWVTLGEISSGKKSAKITSIKPIVNNRSGHAIAVWEESDGYRFEIHGATYFNGSWKPAIPICAEKGKKAQSPSVAIDDYGNAVIAWNQNGVIETKSLIEGNLSEQTLTVSDPNFLAAHPDICVDASGNAVIVFERSNTLHKFIASATLPFKETHWSTPIDISGPSLATSLTAGYPVLSLNSIGDGVAIWKEDDGERLIIQGAGYALNTWSVLKTLSSSKNHPAAPNPVYDMAVAVNFAGNIIAIWPEDSKETGEIQIKATSGVGLATIAPPPPVIDPETVFSGIASGRQVKHKFPAHTDLINIMTWTSPGNVDHFRIYRGNLSSLIGISNTPNFEDHQRSPNKLETYLITSVDEHLRESSPITLVVQPRNEP